MTNWDSIYKELEPTKRTYKTFRSKLDQCFVKFIKKQNLLSMSVLDIGCGEGKYVKYLAELGYHVDAIDQSKTAVEMTKKVLNELPANVKVANMFKFKLPTSKYGLVFSIATIGHGNKKEIKELITNIHKSLINKGKIFITLFDIDQAHSEKKLTKYKKISEGTYAPLLGKEKGVAHSFYNENEARELFSKFKDVETYSGGDCALYVTAIK